MKILVTGGSGYLGSVLVPHLMQLGHHVTVVDTRHPVNDHIYVEGDARDMRVIQPLLWTADVVMPLAGVVGAPACDSDRYGAVTTNQYAVGTLLSRMSSDQRIIFPATDSGYPQGAVDEGSPMNPQSTYAQTKYAAETEVLRERGISLRLASVFGMSPRMRTDLIVNSFVMHAVNRRKLYVYEGHYQRNFVHIRDVASAFSHALTLCPGVYNVGNSAISRTKLEVCELISQHCPGFDYVEVDGTQDPDRRDCTVSNAKIEATGWVARYGLSYGIAELINGYASQSAAA